MFPTSQYTLQWMGLANTGLTRARGRFTRPLANAALLSCWPATAFLGSDYDKSRRVLASIMRRWRLIQGVNERLKTGPLQVVQAGQIGADPGGMGQHQPL